MMSRNTTPRVGDPAPLYICGEVYSHVITRVLSPKRIEVRQCSSNLEPYGPREIVSLRKTGLWVPSGGTADGRTRGHHYVVGSLAR